MEQHQERNIRMIRHNNEVTLPTSLHELPFSKSLLGSIQRLCPY